MRDVLFRGKAYGFGWKYGDISCNNLFLIQDGKMIISESGRRYYVYPESVGEYTGLTDKNGNRIFEGDILSAHLDTVFPEIESRFLVKFEHGAFLLMDKKGLFCDFGGDFEKQFEVIGNMYDNPELWKWSDDK